MGTPGNAGPSWGLLWDKYMWHMEARSVRNAVTQALRFCTCWGEFIRKNNQEDHQARRSIIKTNCIWKCAVSFRFSPNLWRESTAATRNWDKGYLFTRGLFMCSAGWSGAYLTDIVDESKGGFQFTWKLFYLSSFRGGYMYGRAA